MPFPIFVANILILPLTMANFNHYNEKGITTILLICNDQQNNATMSGTAMMYY